MNRPLAELSRTLREPSPEFFRLMVDSIRDYAIFALDPHGCVASWNKGAERVKGWREEEVLGRYYGMFHTEEDQRSGKPEYELRMAREKGRFEEEGPRVRSDGSLYPARVALAPMWDERGEVIGFVKVVQNRTDQVAREQELKRLHDTLEVRVQERTRELQAAVEQLESFSYSISHDLRGPLRAMEGFSSVLLETCADKLGDDGRHYLERIAAAAQRMDRLVHDVLALSRIQRAKLPLTRVELNRLVPELVDQYRHLHDGAAQIVVQPDLLPVLAHEPSVVQCVSNLLANAVKFARPGVRPRVELATEAMNRDVVRLWVRDNGVGIREGDRDRIFKIFEQVLAPSQPAGGSGIGLAIVKSAVERMGGRVGVESQLGHGSAFFIELPAAPPDSRP